MHTGVHCLFVQSRTAFRSHLLYSCILRSPLSASKHDTASTQHTQQAARQASKQASEQAKSQFAHHQRPRSLTPHFHLKSALPHSRTLPNTEGRRTASSNQVSTRTALLLLFDSCSTQSRDCVVVTHPTCQALIRCVQPQQSRA